MKNLRKKAATIGLAGAILTAGGLAGCGDSLQDVSNLEERLGLISAKDVYIVVSENGIDTLHKGDVVTHIWNTGGEGGPASLPTVLRFNCGKEVQTYQFVAYLQGRPQKDMYDEVCECALEATLSPNHKDKKDIEDSILEDEREL